MKSKEQLFNDYFTPDSRAQDSKYDIMRVIKYAQVDAYHSAINDLLENSDELNDWQTEITIDALNHYWNYVIEKLSRTDLGDIERKNLELDKERTHSTLRHLGAF